MGLAWAWLGPACVHVCMHACIHTYIQTHTHTHIYINKYAREAYRSYQRYQRSERYQRYQRYQRYRSSGLLRTTFRASPTYLRGLPPRFRLLTWQIGAGSSAGLLTGSTDLRTVWAGLLTGSTDFAVPPPICETCRPTRLRQTSQIGAGSGFRAIRFDERLGHLVQQIGAGSGFYAIRFDECLGQLVQQCAS